MKTFHVMPYRQLFAPLTIGFGAVRISDGASTSPIQTPQVEGWSTGAETESTAAESL